MSTISLDNQLFMEIKIDDKDIPTSLVNFLKQAYVIENVGFQAPALVLELNDSIGVFSNTIPITDGNKITITLGDSPSSLKENYSMDFRVFSWSAKQYQEGLTYTIHCIFDNYAYIKNVKQMALKGPSQDVIKTIAEDCNIDFICTDQCSDTQTWLNFSDTLAMFASNIAKHSLSPKGCMVLALTAVNDLLYVDIVKALASDAEAVFTSGELTNEASFLIREFSISSDAGFYNSWLNYGYIGVEDLLTGVSKEYRGLEYTTFDGLLPINSDVSESIQSVRKDYYPQDCGNTHSKYWLAKNNNIRILGLFSQKIVILVDKATNISLLAVVEVKLFNTATHEPLKYSGKYIVGAKKTLIKGTKYAEIFELYRPTVPLKGTASLASTGQAPGTYNATSTPEIPPDITTIVSGEAATTTISAPSEVPTLPTITQVVGDTAVQTTVTSETTSTFDVIVTDLGDVVT